MKLLFDMNLSPVWVEVMQRAGYDAIHWSSIGDFTETDHVIMAWARTHGYVICTHDLDFGAILASTSLHAPSVVQLRAQNITPENCASYLLETLTRFANELASGALITVDMERSRVRLLPIG